ncbi:hypothetical protein DFP72DRAFT_901591 [Ephemerocybe angulata]|uniref:MYND-type domain-containing protein n=1 Tax=Ephemerocybe angulata TaxID=980116 RepID=A0A8H6HV27_9AGAR|nr:hypothetical protein DFP72DRAFT_901591 [Tulosesus angulatus]
MPPASRIQSSLLTKAKSLTDFDALVDLANSTTLQNYSPDVLEVFLHHLRPELITLPASANASRGEIELAALRVRSGSFCATQGLCTVMLRGCSRIATPYREASVQTLLSHLDAIIAWFTHIISLPDWLWIGINDWNVKDPNRICLTLRALTDFDSRLERAIYSLPCVPDIVLSAYNLRDAEGMPYLTFVDFFHSCPIVSLFSIFPYYDGPRQMLFDILCEPTPIAERLRLTLVESTTGRFNRLGELDRKTIEAQLLHERSDVENSLTVAESVMLYLVNLWQSVEDICSYSTIMLAAHLNSNFLVSVIRTLETWLIKRSNHNEPGDKKLRIAILQILPKALDLLQSGASVRGQQCIRTMAQIVDEGGLVAIITEMMESVSTKDERWPVLLGLLGRFKSLSLYPTPSMKVVRSLQSLRGQQLFKTDFLRGKGHERYWTVMTTDIHTASASAVACRRAVHLCDNLKCVLYLSTNKRPSSRTCSGCRAVVYCSQACQVLDWNEQHREECRQARADYYDLAQDKMHYPQRLRDFHTRYIHAKAGSDLDMSMADTKKKSPRIIVLDTWESSAYTFKEYPYHHRLDITPRKPRATGPVHYFDERAGKILREFSQQGGAKRGVFIVEGIFQYGEKEVFVMVKLHEVTAATAYRSGEYTIASSVVRIGPARVSPPGKTEASLRARARL